LTFRLARLAGLAQLSSLLLLCCLTLAALADDRLPQPKGPVVLSISGDIQRTTDGVNALFDVSMLEALGLVTVRTRTPWTEGMAEFQGVLLRDVLRLVGAKRETIHAAALNDYVAEIPSTDAAQHDVILALKKDGEYLTVRNMGPILVLYPFDSDPALQTEEVYARSVWQLARLEVGTPAEDVAAATDAELAEGANAPEALGEIAPASGGEPATPAPAEAAPAAAPQAATEPMPAPSASAADAGAEPEPAEPAVEVATAEPAPAPDLAPAPEAATAPAAGGANNALTERFGNIPNGASFERNLLGGADASEGSE